MKLFRSFKGKITIIVPSSPWKKFGYLMLRYFFFFFDMIVYSELFIPLQLIFAPSPFHCYLSLCLNVKDLCIWQSNPILLQYISISILTCQHFALVKNVIWYYFIETYTLTWHLMLCSNFHCHFIFL